MPTRKRRYLSDTKGREPIAQNPIYTPEVQRQIINDYSHYKAQDIERRNADDINKMNIFALPFVLGRLGKAKYFTNTTNPDYKTVLGYEDWLIRNGYKNRPASNWRGTGGGGSW